MGVKLEPKYLDSKGGQDVLLTCRYSHMRLHGVTTWKIEHSPP